MKATKCDRCKKYFDTDTPATIIYKHSSDEPVEYCCDVCDECLKEFIKFMKMEE